MAKNNVVKIEEGKEKIQNLFIQFDEIEYNERNAGGLYEFPTAQYNDIAGYQVNGDLLGITKKDGGNIVIPMRRIRSIETSFINKE